MTLVRWQPERDVLFNMQREVGRLFDDMMNRPLVGTRSGDGWFPPVDIEEQADAFVVEMDLPGIKNDEIKITMENNTLSIRGERKQEQTQEEPSYHICERRFGVFQRAFTLPQGVDGAKIRAAFKDGVLTITLPKAEQARAREINIDVK